MKTIFYPKGVCSRKYEVELEDGVIKSIDILGGCNGNLKAVRNLITNRPAAEIIPFLRGITCGPRPTSCGDQISYALEEALNKEKEDAERRYTSSLDTDMAKEYMLEEFPLLKSEYSPRFGAADASQVVLKPVYFDELMYVLNAPGTHVILFGGAWSRLTRGIIDRVNYYAREHGVEQVYLFDFRADGADAQTSFKSDLTEQETYDGPDKKESVACANCNFIYGELVSRYLTNLNDWVEEKIGTEDEITYLNVYQDAVTVPNLSEPFLFVYNKDNKVNNSTTPHEKEGETFPIVSAMEITELRGADDKMYRDEKCRTEAEGFDERMEALFASVGPEGAVSYTDADYLFDAFKQNERGHAFKTEDCFKKDEAINIEPIALPQLLWMLKQNGTFLFLFAGAWCANSQGGIATVNDFAVANHVRVYMLDTRLDGKYPIDFWGYPRQNELSLSHAALQKYSFEIWEKRLPGAPILLSRRKTGLAWLDRRSTTVDYVDEEGEKHSILPINLPYLIACDLKKKDANGYPQPVLAGCNHGGIELINCKESFVYSKPNYRLYTAGVYSVMDAYCRNVGIEPEDITIDRTAPVVEGEPVHYVERPAYHKEHNWYRERGKGEANTAEAEEVAQTGGDACSIW